MSTPDRIRVAAAQYPLDEVPSFPAWQAKMAAWVAQGAATGARLLVFPEYGLLELAAIGGVAARGDAAATLTAVAGLSAEAERHVGKLASQHGLYILAPSGPARAGGQIVNRAALIAPSGAVGHQDKQIMTPFEREWGMVPGHGLNVFDTALGRIGIAICYDSEFPLLVRGLTEAGAELVLIPSCTEQLSGYHRVRAAAAARALESQIATLTAPTVGDAPWCAAIDRNTGAAACFVPPEAALSMTGVVAEGTLDEPGWISVDIDLAALRRVRDSGEMRNAHDWPSQPGATPLAAYVQVMMLV